MSDYNDIYKTLTPGGQRYMSTLLMIGQSSPKKIQYVLDKRSKAKQRGFSDLSKLSAKLPKQYQVLNNTIQYLHFLPSQSDMSKVDKYFEQADYLNQAKIHNLADDFNKKHPVPAVGSPQSRMSSISNQQAVRPSEDRHHEMRGVRLYQHLSQRGRKYLLTATKEASYNYNDFKAVRDATSNELTPTQLEMRQRIDRAGNYRRSQNDGHIVPRLDSVAPEEREEVDSYLKSPSTQSDLEDGTSYNMIIKQNMRERQLAETRDDEATPDKRKGLTRAGLAGGIYGSARLNRKGKLNQNQQTGMSNVNPVKKHHKFNFKPHFRTRPLHHIHEDGPEL